MQFVDIFKEFYDVFAWSYDDLKEYYKEIFQHVIPLKEGAILVRQNPKTMNPELNPLVKFELEKMENDGIFFTWLW